MWNPFRKAAPIPADVNPASSGYMIPPDESPAWIPESVAHSGNANQFMTDPSGWGAQPVILPDPTLGGYYERADWFGWSDGLGNAFGGSAPFDGALLDPSMDPLASNMGGMVGLNTMQASMGRRLATMYYPDNATQQQVAAAYEAYFSGQNKAGG